MFVALTNEKNAFWFDFLTLSKQDKYCKFSTLLSVFYAVYMIDLELAFT